MASEIDQRHSGETGLDIEHTEQACMNFEMERERALSALEPGIILWFYRPFTLCWDLFFVIAVVADH